MQSRTTMRTLGEGSRLAASSPAHMAHAPSPRPATFPTQSNASRGGGALTPTGSLPIATLIRAKCSAVVPRGAA